MMLRVGVVGVGGISPTHIDGWNRMPDAAVHALCDIRPKQLDPYRDRPGVGLYTDLDEMLTKEELDVLDICLPTYLHVWAAEKGLSRGLHVCTEKPIGLRKEDVAHIYGLAKEKGKFFMVAQVLRFWPEYLLVKQAYDEGTYGKLLCGTMERMGGTPYREFENWLCCPEKGGRVELDLHIHDLDFLVYAFGTPVSSQVRRNHTEKQNVLRATYDFAEFSIDAQAAWLAGKYAFNCGFRFIFERAVMEYKDNRLTVFPADGAPFQPMTAEGSDAGKGLGLPATDAYFNELRYFADCINAGTPPAKVDPRQLETVLSLLEPGQE